CDFEARMSFDRLPSLKPLEAEGEIGVDGPARDVGPDDVGNTKSNPLKLPDLVQGIQHQATMNLVHARNVQAFPQATPQHRMTDEASGTQLVAPGFDPERDIHINGGGDSVRVARNVEFRMRAAEALGVEVGGVGRERDDGSIEQDQV